MLTQARALWSAIGSVAPTVWFSSLTALVAVIVGPLIQLRIAKRQIRSTMISANRQVWINTLRDNLATLWAYSSDVRELRVAYTNDPVLTAKIQDEAREARILLNRIRLSVNTSEGDHHHLVQIVERLWNIADSVGPNNTKGQEWQETIKDLMTTAPQMLKKEWERVKKGD
jgi:hypothetical protein